MLHAGIFTGLSTGRSAYGQVAFGQCVDIIASAAPRGPFWNASDMGVPSDDTPCADFLEQALAIIEGQGGGTLFFPAGQYRIERSVLVPLGVSLEGASNVHQVLQNGEIREGLGTVLKPDPNGSYVKDFVFYLNVDSQNLHTWITPFPHQSCGVRNLIFDARNSDIGRNGFYFSGTYEFSNILASGVATLIEKPRATYTDAVVIRNIHATNTRARSDKYLINLPGLGDAYEIDGIASGYMGAGMHMTRGLYLGPVRGCKVANLVNGRHKFEGGVYDISALHLEGGDVEISDPMGGRLGDSYFATEEEENAAPIFFTSKRDNSGNRYTFTVENNVFSRTVNRRGGWPHRWISDVVLDDRVSVVLSNNHRRYVAAGQIRRGQVHGIFLSKKDGTPLKDFNQYSHVLSRRTVYVTQNRLTFDPAYIPAQSTAIPGLEDRGQKPYSDARFTGESARYFYNAQILQDPVRLAGRAMTNAEVSAAAILGKSVITLGWKWGRADFPGDVMIRLYRGRRSGSYDHYVDLPVISLGEMIDLGHAINGFLWQSRQARGMDAINKGLTGEIVLRPTSADLISQGGLPVLGRWKRGDYVTRIGSGRPAAGRGVPIGWQRLRTGDRHRAEGAPDWRVDFSGRP